MHFPHGYAPRQRLRALGALILLGKEGPRW